MREGDLFETTASLLESDSDKNKYRKRGGSVPGKAPNLERGRNQGGARLYASYFAPDPVYGLVPFTRRF